MPASDDPIDELYGVELEEFVSARTALARRLRSDGDRAGADAVKKLAKPTRAAWAVNRLVRDRPQEIGALVEAGEALAGAQEQLLDGAEADVLRGAAEAARRLVDALADEAPVEGTARDKVRATLHAATVDEDVRAEVASGRVVREHSASGFGGLDALLAAGFEARTTPRGPEKGKGSGGRAGARRAARESEREPEPDAPKPDPREVRRRRDALRRAKEAEAKAEEAVTGAQRSLDQVESTIAARRRDLDEARAALDEARDRRERAERAAAEVQEA